MLIIFSGLPGTGKSTIAQILSERLQAVYLRIDTIEQAIRSADDQDRDLGPLGYIIAGEVARDNLRTGATVIADSVNPLALTRDAWRDIALAEGRPFLEIEIICSDTQEHRSRVQNRSADISGLVLPDWEAVIQRRYEPWDRSRLQLDSARLSAIQCADNIVAALPVTRLPLPAGHCGN